MTHHIFFLILAYFFVKVLATTVLHCNCSSYLINFQRKMYVECLDSAQRGWGGGLKKVFFVLEMFYLSHIDFSPPFCGENLVKPKFQDSCTYFLYLSAHKVQWKSIGLRDNDRIY